MRDLKAEPHVRSNPLRAHRTSRGSCLLCDYLAVELSRGDQEMPPRGCTRPARIIVVSEKHNGLLSRRQILGAAVTVPLWRAVSHFQPAQGVTADMPAHSARLLECADG